MIQVANNETLRQKNLQRFEDNWVVCVAMRKALIRYRDEKAPKKVHLATRVLLRKAIKAEANCASVVEQATELVTNAIAVQPERGNEGVKV